MIAPDLGAEDDWVHSEADVGVPEHTIGGEFVPGGHGVRLELAPRHRILTARRAVVHRDLVRSVGVQSIQHSDFSYFYLFFQMVFIDYWLFYLF